MKLSVLTLFPEIFAGYFSSSIMAKAVERGLVQSNLVNIRDYAVDKHKTCDDAPYGGGAGMLMLPGPLSRALETAGAAKKAAGGGQAADEKKARVVYLTPSGRPFVQSYAAELACEPELILLCGRYEGIDQRIIDLYVDDEISVGDYILSSGEVAALAVIDAVYRLLDEVISPESLHQESFTGGLLEYPQWTRPEIYDSIAIPEVLLSGHHENIRKWRLQKSVEKTCTIRPDLIEKGLQNGIFDAETIDLITLFLSRNRSG
ncbi:MAG: tRNA (guanosine(37)-N1)-methyltransferase TrmD [Spirochaetaceae bacterium]|jgi:tRNA (guanine37-N1)-methyltransferase|nr:tRNA (guanosine(37)-N1)-methyltransferase TrmD [Spirochaetaceae bacterium]